MCNVQVMEFGTMVAPATIVYDIASYGNAMVDPAVAPVVAHDAYSKKESGAVQKTESQFRAPTIFAAPNANSTGDADNISPPGDDGGAGNGGNGGGGGRGRALDPHDVMAAMKADIHSMERVEQLQARINTDIANFTSDEGKLIYIASVGRFFEKATFYSFKNTTSRPAYSLKFSAAEILRVVHDIASRVDGLTPYITASGNTKDENHFNTLRPIFISAVRLERELLKKGGLNLDVAEMVADIYSVYIRKGWHENGADERLDGGRGSSFLAQRVLYLIDLINRYSLLELDEKFAQTQKFLNDVITHNRLPKVARSWALSEKLRADDEFISQLAMLRDAGDEIALDSLMTLAENEASEDKGLYLFSHIILGHRAAEFSSQGFPEIAHKYSQAVSENRLIASRLGLIDADYVGKADDIIDVIESYMSEARTAAEVTTRIDEDIAILSDKGDRLRYISNAARIIDANTTDFFKFPAADLIKVVHHLAQIADDTTDYLKVGGKALIYDGVDEHNMFKSLFNASDHLEIELLNLWKLTPDSSRMVADVHFAFARKGRYAYVLNNKIVEDPFWPSVIEVVLNALDVEKRYNVLGLTKDAERVRGFLEEVKSFHDLPADLRSWTFGKISKYINEEVKSFEPDKWEQDAIDRRVKISESWWSDKMRGIYLFSPAVLSRIAETFFENGFREIADSYIDDAEKTFRTARQLKLVE